MPRRASTPDDAPQNQPLSPSQDQEQQGWQIFQGGNADPHDDIEKRLPKAPNWRPFGGDVSSGVSRRKHRGKTFQTRPEEVKMINAALYLRRPLLITGKPGTGKSSIAYAVAEELMLGEVLYWPITTRTTLKSGLYNYDAIGRLQDVKQREANRSSSAHDSDDPDTKEASQPEDEPQNVADFITLGPLGTALLPSNRPRLLLIDEIDKSDIDLPNDLLTIFEEGRFEIPELLRLEKEDPDQPGKTKPIEVRVRTAYSDEQDTITGQELKVSIPGGRVPCKEFPLVIMTSNGERDFPPPFLRRCLRLNMYEPDADQLAAIVKKHFEKRKEDGSLDTPDISEEQIKKWIKTFVDKRTDQQQLATDQLLNALFMVARNRDALGDDLEKFVELFLLAPLNRPLPTEPKSRSADSSSP